MSAVEERVIRKWTAHEGRRIWSVSWDSYFDQFMLYNGEERSFNICEDISARTMFMGLETDRDVYVNVNGFYASIHYYHETDRVELMARLYGEWRHVTNFVEVPVQ